MTQVGDQFKTGQVCAVSGRYQFDGYIEGDNDPSPTAEEHEIPLSKDKTFPPISSAGKACYWRLMERI